MYYVQSIAKIYISAYAHVFMFMFAFMFMYACMHACMYVCVHLRDVYMQMCRHVSMHKPRRKTRMCKSQFIGMRYTCIQICVHVVAHTYLYV